MFSASGESGDSTSNGKFMRTVYFAMAELEANQKREGFAVARSNAIERGIFIGSPSPTGYMRDASRHLVPDPIESPKGTFGPRMRWSTLGPGASS